MVEGDGRHAIRGVSRRQVENTRGGGVFTQWHCGGFLVGRQGEALAPVTAVSVLERIDQSLRGDVDVGKHSGRRLLVGKLAGCVGPWELHLVAVERLAAVADVAADAHERELIAGVQSVVEAGIDTVVGVLQGKAGEVVAEGGKIGGRGKLGLQIFGDARHELRLDHVVGWHAILQSLEGDQCAIGSKYGVPHVGLGGAKYVGEVAGALENCRDGDVLGGIAELGVVEA